jgi:hypothetical protein
MFNPNWYAINPQPLPPGGSSLHFSRFSALNLVALNPQPLPPGPPDPEAIIAILIG